jgi:hypothetical protein
MRLLLAAIVSCLALPLHAQELESLRAGIERHEAAYTNRTLQALPFWQCELLAGRPAGLATVTAADDIQAAIDALPAHGGIVLVPAGVRTVKHPIVLRGNIALLGAPGAVLVRAPFRTARLGEDASASAKSVVAPGHPFQANDRVAIRDDQRFGWDTTRAKVVRIDGDTIHLDRALPRPYRKARRAIVTDAAPMIQAVDAKNVIVRGLILEGELAPAPGGVSDFTDAAIHFHKVSNAILEDVTIRRYPGEALSLQSGVNVIARNNRIEGSLSRGIHIGTGIADSIVTDNITVGNGDDGIYFCASVRNVLVQRNVTVGNGGNGIGGVGDVGDRGNIVYFNTVADNGRNGIAVQESGNVVFRNLLVGNGSRGAPFTDLAIHPAALVNVILENSSY